MNASFNTPGMMVLNWQGKPVQADVAMAKDTQSPEGQPQLALLAGQGAPLPGAAPASEKTVKETEQRYAAKLQFLQGNAQSKIAKARRALTQDDAHWLLQFTSDEIMTNLTQMSAELSALGLDSSELNGIMSKLNELGGSVTKELGNTGPKAFDLVPEGATDASGNPALAPEDVQGGGGTPMDKLEKSYKGLATAMGDVVGRRIILAHVATSLGLPDHAVFFMQKAYADVRSVLDSLIADLNGREPSGKLKDVLATLKGLKDQVLVQTRLALSSNGGPELTMEETEALLAKSDDFENNKNPSTQKILKDFNLNKSPEDLKKNTQSAVAKIAKKMPELLMAVAHSLDTLQQDPNAGAGTAQIDINSALSKLELGKALLRVLIGGQNVFKDQAVAGLDTSRFEGMIEQLEQRANTLFGELEARGFVRGRVAKTDNRPEDLDKILNPHKINQAEHTPPERQPGVQPDENPNGLPGQNPNQLGDPTEPRSVQGGSLNPYAGIAGVSDIGASSIYVPGQLAITA